ncbi:MAG: ParB/RepB/Spo0J family partition protein [Planctomycetota bacterium]
MSDVKPRQRVVSLPVRCLMSHPANPNRMSNAAFNKLARHIERTGQYEPIVVRCHPHKAGTYQILNGVHRVRALKRTGHSRADCVVFDADDTQALVYLASLNQLKGRSNVKNKSRLVGQLCKHCNSKQLAQLLPDSIS